MSHWRQPRRLVVGGTEPATLLDEPMPGLEALGRCRAHDVLDLRDVPPRRHPGEGRPRDDGREPRVAGAVPRSPVVEFAWRVPLRMKCATAWGSGCCGRCCDRYVPDGAGRAAEDGIRGARSSRGWPARSASGVGTSWLRRGSAGTDSSAPRLSPICGSASRRERVAGRTCSGRCVMFHGVARAAMKVCFVCSEYPPSVHGGIGTYTAVLGQALRRRGHEVRVIGVYPPTVRASRSDRTMTACRSGGSRAARPGRMARGPLPALRHDPALGPGGRDRLRRGSRLRGLVRGLAPAARAHHLAPARRRNLLRGRSRRSGRTRCHALAGESLAHGAPTSCAPSAGTPRDAPRRSSGSPRLSTTVLYNPIEVPPASDWSDRDVQPGGIHRHPDRQERRGRADTRLAVVLERCPGAELHMYGKEPRSKTANL